MTKEPIPTPGLDSILHSAIGRLTGGLSPAALDSAGLDWARHLQGSVERQAELLSHGWTNAMDAWLATLASALAEETPEIAARRSADDRFSDPAWSHPPFNLFAHWFLLQEAWWNHATAPIAGLEPRHQKIVAFMARQMLDMMAPSNHPLTNPEVVERTREEGGMNFLRGLENWLEDFNEIVTGRPKPHPEYRVGETVAATPGDVVFRNRLIELIRYRPTTARVHAEPILIVPAWIMKYYILDLSPSNSLAAWLCDRGFEVYMISWKNPDAEDADLGLDDYLELGFRAALDHVAPDPADRVHAVGYCLGGTLLAAAAAAMARDDDKRLATLSLLAAQVDFSEPGEISLFISESQVAFLEDMMATQGYLRADQMAGAFRMLRSTDLIWSRVIRHYLLGERTRMNDLMAWNADATRMPARMHSEYLRHLFLENDLARGRFEVRGGVVALADIRAPVFCLATETDHVSPWHSVYKLNLLADTDVTFCLTNGGHNGGVISEPGHARRHFRLRRRVEGEKQLAPEAWYGSTAEQEGSWWPAWTDWLAKRSGPMRRLRKAPAQPLGPAPGTYVFG